MIDYILSKPAIRASVLSGLFLLAISSTASARLSADDRLDILQLYARYSQTIDNALLEEFTDLFAPTAIIQEPDVCAVGRAQIKDFGGLYGRGDVLAAHMPYNIVIDGDGEHAKGRADLYSAGQELPFPPGTAPTAEQIAAKAAQSAPSPSSTKKGPGYNWRDHSPYFNPEIHLGWMGIYTDTFVKLKGQWYFESRHIWVQKPAKRFAQCPTDLLKEATLYVPPIQPAPQ